MKRIAPLAFIVLGLGLVLIGGAIVVYLRIFSAGFVGLDNDMYVYANPFLNSNLGIVLMKMNLYDRALQALSTAATMEPSSPTFLFNEANALAAVGQFDNAEAAFRRCISLAPILAGAHTGLGSKAPKAPHHSTSPHTGCGGGGGGGGSW